MRRSLLMLFVCVCFVSRAHAAIAVEWVPVDNSSALTGYKTFDLYVTTESGTCCAAMLLELTQGSLYYFHSDVPILSSLYQVNQPVSKELVDLLGPIFPEAYAMEYATYVGVGGQQAALAGGAGDVGGDGLEFSAQEIDASWYGFDYPVGRVHMGRFTMTANAVGNWTVYAVALDPATDPSMQVSGVLIPEPASLAALLVSGSLLCGRGLGCLRPAR